MPAFKERLTVEITRGLKAFLNVEAGFTRGSIPDPERSLEQALLQRDYYQRQLERTKKQLAEKNRELKQATQKATAKNRGGEP